MEVSSQHWEEMAGYDLIAYNWCQAVQKQPTDTLFLGTLPKTTSSHDHTT